MAIRTILLRKKLADKRAEQEKLRSQMKGFKTREDEIAQQIQEATTEEEKAAVEAAVEELETSQATVKERLSAVADEIADILNQIEESEMAQEEALSGETGDGSDMADDEQRSRHRGERRSNGMRMEQREAQEFQRTGRHTYKNVRSLVRAALTSSNAAKPTGVGGINDAIGGVSSLIDLIKITDCTGMGTYKVAIMTGDAADASAITEGQVPTEGEPTFTSVDLTPTNYGTIGYVSKEIRKQTPLDYESKVTESARRSLRRKLNSVAAAAVAASGLNTVMELEGASGSALFTPNLLSDIILEYGGDEGVEGTGCLFLTKADLKAFAAVRGKNEYLPVYSIVPDTANPSTGIIKDNYGLSCRYCLSKDVKPLAGATLTSSATKHMFYGNPQCLEMGLWGGFDVEVNDGYKFGEGLLTVRGEVSADAEVTVKNGFVVVSAKLAG